MAAKFEQTFPIAYGIDWSQSTLTLPERKAAETDLLEAVIGLAKAFGASNVEVKEIHDVPERRAKVVTLVGEGNLDSEALSHSLRKLSGGQTE